jgi:hypothetical protein
MNRKFLIAANLKMNPVPAGALGEDSPYRDRSNVDIASQLSSEGR